MGRTFLAAFLAVFLLLCISTAAYQDLSITVSVHFKPDGSAKVSEKYSFLLSGDSEIESFEYYRNLGQNTIVSWRRFSKDLKYHVGADIIPSNASITARRVLNIGSRSAELVLEYALNTPIMAASQVSSRKKVFSLKDGVLGFAKTTTGEMILSPSERLEFYSPSEFKVDSTILRPEPTSITDSLVTWNGPFTAKLSYSFYSEELLSEEVSRYFNEATEQLTKSAPSLIPIFAILIFAGFIIKYLKERNEK